MKKKIVGLVLIVIALGVVGKKVRGGFWDDVGSVVTAPVKAVKSAAEKTGDFMKARYGDVKKMGTAAADGAVSAGNAGLKFATNLGGDCATAAALWSQWVAQKGAFLALQGAIQAQKGVLSGAQHAFNGAKGAANAAKGEFDKVRNELQDFVKKGLGPINAALKFVAGNFDKLFDINKVEFTAKLSELPQLKTPEFVVDGILAGKKFSVKTQLNAKAIAGKVGDLFKSLF